MRPNSTKNITESRNELEEKLKAMGILEVKTEEASSETYEIMSSCTNCDSGGGSCSGCSGGSGCGGGVIHKNIGGMI